MAKKSKRKSKRVHLGLGLGKTPGGKIQRLLTANGTNGENGSTTISLVRVEYRYPKSHPDPKKRNRVTSYSSHKKLVVKVILKNETTGKKFHSKRLGFVARKRKRPTSLRRIEGHWRRQLSKRLSQYQYKEVIVDSVLSIIYPMRRKKGRA